MDEGPIRQRLAQQRHGGAVGGGHPRLGVDGHDCDRQGRDQFPDQTDLHPVQSSRFSPARKRAPLA